MGDRERHLNLDGVRDADAKVARFADAEVREVDREGCLHLETGADAALSTAPFTAFVVPWSVSEPVKDPFPSGASRFNPLRSIAETVAFW